MLYPSEAQQVLDTAARCGWDHTVHWSQGSDVSAWLQVTVSGDEQAFVLYWRVLDGDGTLCRAYRYHLRHAERRRVDSEIDTPCNSIARNPRPWAVSELHRAA